MPQADGSSRCPWDGSQGVLSTLLWGLPLPLPIMPKLNRTMSFVTPADAYASKAWRSGLISVEEPYAQSLTMWASEPFLWNAGQDSSVHFRCMSSLLISSLFEV